MLFTASQCRGMKERGIPLDSSPSSADCCSQLQPSVAYDNNRDPCNQTDISLLDPAPMRHSTTGVSTCSL